MLLTGAGAALPFAVIAAILAYPAYRTRRWYQARRTTPRHAPRPPPSPNARQSPDRDFPVGEPYPSPIRHRGAGGIRKS